MIWYVKCFDTNKAMSSKVADKKLLKNSSYKGLLLKMLDSAIKAIKKYYPQTLLEERNYETKNTKMENLINDELESSSSHNQTKCDYESDNE